jgi:hypothetical protein
MTRTTHVQAHQRGHNFNKAALMRAENKILGTSNAQKRKEKLVQELKSLSDNPDFFAEPGQKFNNNENCIIWTGAETEFRDGIPLADYYNHTQHPKFTAFLKKHHLEMEWYDPGTITIYNA